MLEKLYKGEKKSIRTFHRWENWSTIYQQQSQEKNLGKSVVTFCTFPDIFIVFSPISRSICYLRLSHFPYKPLVKLKPTFLSQCFNNQLGRSWKRPKPPCTARENEDPGRYCRAAWVSHFWLLLFQRCSVRTNTFILPEKRAISY